MRKPSNSPVTLLFGATTDPYSEGSPHNGTDFAYTPDNKIYAPFAGTVTLIPNNGRDGNGIYMHNGNQFHGLLHSSRYLVADGQTVQEGQAIGIMGQTGFAQGPHLHWAVKVDNQFIDPLTLVKENDMIETPDQAAEIVRATFGREPTEHEIQDLMGRNWYDAIRAYRTSSPGQAVNAEVINFPKLQQQVSELRTALDTNADKKKLQALIAVLQDDLKKYGDS